MAEFFLNLKLFAMLRATRATTTRRPTPQQQPETEYQAFYEESEEDTSSHSHAHPENDTDDHAEQGTEAEDDGDRDNTPQAPSRASGILGTAGNAINALRKCVVDKAAVLAAQARDAVLDAVEKVKKLRWIGTAKAIRDWIKLHPWETALILVPLVALACTAIALSFTGFGPAGIFAGM
jgi:hypothetical protein